MRIFNKKGYVIFGLFWILAVGGFAFPEKAIGAGGEDTTVQRGKYLVLVAGCNDCHSPKQMTKNGPVPDETKLLSGHQGNESLPPIPTNIIGPDKWGGVFNNSLTGWVGPWGTSYASNLTPDRETGIGNWNDTFFLKILRTGKFMGGDRDILPPMPWQDIGRLTDADLKAIFAYLKSLKPVNNRVPPSAPALPSPH